MCGAFEDASVIGIGDRFHRVPLCGTRSVVAEEKSAAVPPDRWFSGGAWPLVLCAIPLATMLRGGFIGTDFSEIVDGDLIRTSWAGLTRTITNGISGYYYRPMV